MITKSAVLGIVLVAAIMGGYLYFSSDHSAEEITVEFEVSKEPYINVDSINVKGVLIFTSSKGNMIHAEGVPNLVLTKGSERIELQAATDSLYAYPTKVRPQDMKSGAVFPTTLVYKLDRPLDLTQYSYHFDLCLQMKDAGNYKLV